MSQLVAIVLAAGHGTRMKSLLPKVLHSASGRPLVYYPVQAALSLGARQVVVVVNEQTKELIGEELARHVPAKSFVTAVQAVPRGTGDAARVGMEALEVEAGDSVLILSGDAPLLQSDNLRGLVSSLQGGEGSLAFMTFLADDPTGYGRVLRDKGGQVTEIREHKDLSSGEERAIVEVNAGVYALRAGALSTALSKIEPNNAQGEFYLTDIVALIAKEDSALTVLEEESVLAGVNDRYQLRQVELQLHDRKREALTKMGVTIRGTPLIDDSVEVARDVCLEDGVRLRGNTKIGANTLIDVGAVIVDSTIGEHVYVKPYCVVTESLVGDKVQLGPFAHLRPQSVLEEGVHIGNFVETKKTLVKKGAKANHLSYLGDAEIGEKSNIGAGTIVCNYDGYVKSKTIVGKDVFVGSSSQLVAPLKIGDGAFIATATTVVQDVPEDALAIGRARQDNKLGYASKLRARLKAAALEFKSRL